MEDTAEEEKELHSASSENNFKKTIRSTRMKLVPQTVNAGFVRRSSRAYKGKKTELSELSDEENEVQINKLPVNTLRKYKRFYNLAANANISKLKLSKLVESHFKKIDVSSENEIITYFIHFIKTHKG